MVDRNPSEAKRCAKSSLTFRGRTSIRALAKSKVMRSNHWLEIKHQHVHFMETCNQTNALMLHHSTHNVYLSEVSLLARL